VPCVTGDCCAGCCCCCCCCGEDCCCGVIGSSRDFRPAGKGRGLGTTVLSAGWVRAGAWVRTEASIVRLRRLLPRGMLLLLLRSGPGRDAVVSVLYVVALLKVGVLLVGVGVVGVSDATSFESKSEGLLLSSSCDRGDSFKSL